jgi:ElaB/YqjD/DUF883 family membrane-anchored ribosome-binding protein
MRVVPESPTRRGPVAVSVTGEDLRLPEKATDKPLGEWTPEALEDLRESRAWFQKQNSRFRSVREKVAPLTDFVQDRASDARRRLHVIRGRFKSGEVQQQWRGRASGFAEEASRRVGVARSRAEHYARKYPLQFIAGTAAAGFVIGFLLRMWRDE